MSNYYLVRTTQYEYNGRFERIKKNVNVNVIIRLPQQPIPCTHNLIQEQVNCKRLFKDSLTHHLVFE